MIFNMGSGSFASVESDYAPMLVLSDTYLSIDHLCSGGFKLFSGKFLGVKNWKSHNDSIYFVSESYLCHFEGETVARVPLAECFSDSYLELIDEKYVGISEYKKYAFYDRSGNILLKNELKDRVDGLCYYHPDLHIVYAGKNLVAFDSALDERWRASLRVGDIKGSVKEAVSNPQYARVFVKYFDQQGHKIIYVLDSDSGEILAAHYADQAFRGGSFVLRDKNVFFADRSSFCQVDIDSGAVVKKVALPKVGEPLGTAYTKNTICLMHTENAQLLILDKNTLEVLHALALGQGKYKAVDIAGNSTGLMVKLQSNAAIRSDESAYGVFLTDDQLLQGFMPDLTPEKLEASIDKVLVEGALFDVRISVNPGLSAADFLRHTSQALWSAAFQYATYVSAIDDTEARSGDPDFNGRLILDISAYRDLDKEHQAAMDGIIEGAKTTMQGWGPLRGCLWVDLGTDSERTIELEVVW